MEEFIFLNIMTSLTLRLPNPENEIALELSSTIQQFFIPTFLFFINANDYVITKYTR